MKHFREQLRDYLLVAMWKQARKRVDDRVWEWLWRELESWNQIRERVWQQVKEEVD